MAPVETSSPPATRRRPLFAETKFTAPPLRPSLVVRDRLVARLRSTADLPLNIVVGPPGSGKSSLLGQWYFDIGDHASAWLNADRGDDDPSRFWRGFIRSVQQLEPEFGEDATALISLDGHVTTDALESLLVDDAALRRQIRVVIDDFHLVSLLAAQQMQHLLDRGLRNVRLVLGARSDPVVGLHRLRVLGMLGEIREADLRLDLEESRMVLRTAGVDPDAVDLTALHERTEGWAAGLMLAALSVRGSDDPAARIRELAGSAKTIAGYLTAEVLSNQPAELREFLRLTCVTDELDASMVEALLGPDFAGPRVTLEEVEAANLFLTRLDDAGTVFRYHHLFGEMLRYQFQSQDHERFREQHRRAGAAYERAGDVALAVRHYWSAGDHRAASSLVRDQVVPVYLGIDVAPPLEVPHTLSDNELVASASDAVGYAVPLIINGHNSAAAALLAHAEALFDPLTTPVIDRLHVACSRIAAEFASGHAPEAVACAERVVDLLHHHGAEPDDMTAACIPFAIRACAWDGQFDTADRFIRDLHPHPDPRLTQIDIVSTLALVDLERGDLTEAIERARSAHVTAGLLDVAGDGGDVAARVVIGQALLERGDLDGAALEFDAVLDSSPVGRIPTLVLAAIGRARELRARGRFDAALRSLTSMRGRLASTGVGPTFAARLDITEIGVRLALGEIEAADRLAAALPEGFRSDLARAWVGLHQDRVAFAANVSDSLAVRAGTRRHSIELGVLRMRLALIQGNPDLELFTEQVLSAAEPVGFVLPIAEGGAAVLHAAIQGARRRPRTPFVERLLLTQPLPRPADQARPAYTVDELSARELVVLRFMATSMTNQEIADELYLSVNTVKTHIKHVLRKLGGTARADAVRRAQELHYL